MIQSSFNENRSVFFRVLSDDQIWEIKRAAFDILDKTGAKILHKEARQMLKKAGATVKDEVVKLPESPGQAVGGTAVGIGHEAARRRRISRYVELGGEWPPCRGESIAGRSRMGVSHQSPRRGSKVPLQ